MHTRACDHTSSSLLMGMWCCNMPLEILEALPYTERVLGCTCTGLGDFLVRGARIQYPSDLSRSLKPYVAGSTFLCIYETGGGLFTYKLLDMATMLSKMRDTAPSMKILGTCKPADPKVDVFASFGPHT